ncbi:lipid transfer protein EARLI 1-like [Momordica charantia]|uniref:Lipid transfer protein EARLI 1-like n=1 Tax=Momordica charantia TaxID=3673 RepID=A0A6J1BRR9_MOMCH|nr:lipid transfer protein EARLI 1-like [Momordica charantia]
MASKNLSSTTLLFSLLLLIAVAAAGVPCDQPKTKPAPATPKIKPSPEIPKIIRPSPAVQSAHCPKDTLKFGACTNILGVVGGIIGSPVSSKCCGLVSGLTDAEAAVCLCTAIKANVLGIHLNVPVSLSLLLSSCQKSVPTGYQCK